MKKTTIKIEGMMCGMCESHINDVVRKNFKVKSVKSSAKKGQTVVVSEESLSREELVARIDETGYRFIDCTEEDYVKKGLFGR